jgi:triacylglycerol lipase
MHGLGSFAHLLARGGFASIAQHLHANGLVAFAPVVDPYNTISIRAKAWSLHLERLLDEHPFDGFHLIGFSTGGLDARYLIHELGGHRYVRSLTTISTPHAGTSLASYVLDGPRFVRRILISGMNSMGNRQFKSRRAAAEEALRELTPEFLAVTFNPNVPLYPDIRYESYAGCAGRGTDTPIYPFLIYPNRILYEREGLNDGIVSVQSANWESFQGTICACHARQFGIKTLRGSFNARQFYLSLAWKLIHQGS